MKPYPSDSPEWRCYQTHYLRQHGTRPDPANQSDQEKCYWFHQGLMLTRPGGSDYRLCVRTRDLASDLSLREDPGSLRLTPGLDPAKEKHNHPSPHPREPELHPISEFLSESEIDFLTKVVSNPGATLTSAAFSPGSETLPWERCETLGLIKSVGTCKWIPTTKLILACPA